jgi:hypothetical protein
MGKETVAMLVVVALGILMIGAFLYSLTNGSVLVSHVGTNVWDLSLYETTRITCLDGVIRVIEVDEASYDVRCLPTNEFNFDNLRGADGAHDDGLVGEFYDGSYGFIKGEWRDD